MSNQRFRILPERIPARVSVAIGKSIGRLGITPNMITLVGAMGSGLAAWLILEEQLLLAGAVFLGFSALDFVDGAVARATGQATPYGAFLDSVMDRVGEALVIAACIWYFAERGEDLQAGFAFTSLFGSIAVSYVRARGEALGVRTKDGMFRRQERVLLLGIGLLANGLTVVIIILAVMTNATALQRWGIIGKELRKKDQEITDA
ncbi:MAG: CDP-alcohol phosphatidyltransferase [Dehalococcoidia bacterium]|nr:CDP-alcohol phosphatidyltransferase [Dehalococcoidia bacterium]